MEAVSTLEILREDGWDVILVGERLLVDNALEDLDEAGVVARVVDAREVPAQEAGRSTPPEYEDCAEVVSRTGSTWRYSAPSDTWCLVLGAQGVSLSSSRSFDRLEHEYGPLEDA